MKKILSFHLCLFLLVLSIPVFGQEAQKELTPVKKRPKIGLALSGGGARGLAHIGVLEWFEEHHIPVDYIAGTSMGGLVAAMYAMGMSPAEMRDFVNTLNWDEALGSGPSYERQSFRRKEDRRAFQNELEFGLKEGFSSPSGFNPGHAIGLMFDRLTLPYSNLKSFDELPIPFRCVATDMIEAKPVILKDGSLPVALRATMAIPGVFTPVQLDGKVLADGGLLNNIPTDVVRQMGADIVIAVDIGTPLGDRKALASLFGVLEQSISVMTIDNDRRNLRLADIILAPDLGVFTREDYRASKALMDLGYKGTAEKEVVLKNFSLDNESWQTYSEAKRAKKKSDKVVPQDVAIIGTNPDTNEKIKDSLKEKYVGKVVDTNSLESDLTDITGEGRFESVGYETVRKNNQTNLLIRVKEKDYGPPFLHIGFVVDGSEINRVQFTINGRLTFFDVGTKGSEWRLDARLGSETLLGSEYYLRLGQTGFFVAPYTYYDKSFRNLFSGNRQVAEYQVRRAGIGGDVGYAFGKRSEVRLGYELANLSAKVRVGDPFLPEISGDVREAKFRWRYDSQDDPVIPTRGIRTDFVARHVFETPGADYEFNQAEFTASKFKPINSKGTAFAIFSGGTTFNQNAPPEQIFTVGGPFRLGAYNKDEFAADHYFVASGGYLRRIGTLPSLIGDKIYAGAWYEFGGIYQSDFGTEYLNNLSGGIILKTRFGPVSIGGSVGERGRGRIYFSLGRVF